jgi:hypothetical protein
MKYFSALKSLVIAVSICTPIYLKAQVAPTAKPNWQNLDLKIDSVFGISTEKTYRELLKDKKHIPVLVAVIDGGVDIDHEDLKQVIWNNPSETAGNNTDDDKNGYIDDIHGWDFIGSAKGNVQFDNTELVRQVRLYGPKYANTDTTKLTGKDLERFKTYSMMKDELAAKVKKANKTYKLISAVNGILDGMLVKMNNANPQLKDFENYHAANDAEAYVKRL